MFTGLVELRASVQALIADPPGVRSSWQLQRSLQK